MAETLTAAPAGDDSPCGVESVGRALVDAATEPAFSLFVVALGISLASGALLQLPTYLFFL